MNGDPPAGVVLDTHSMVWLLQGSTQLGQGARRRIQRAADTSCLKIPAIALWEFAMLVSRGRLVIDRDPAQWLAAALALPGIEVAPLTPEVAVQSTRLPQAFHGDPADRMIVATARVLDAVLITADKAILAYAREGHVKALRAGAAR